MRCDEACDGVVQGTLLISRGVDDVEEGRWAKLGAAQNMTLSGVLKVGGSGCRDCPFRKFLLPPRLVSCQWKLPYQRDLSASTRSRGVCNGGHWRCRTHGATSVDKTNHQGRG